MKVVIAGMGGGFPGLDGWEDAEWWQCKQGYMLQRRVDRIYQMDRWADLLRHDVPALIKAYGKLDCPVVLIEPHPEIPKSEAYPIDRVAKAVFGGMRPWFASVISYMIADAIHKGAKKILLWRILENVTAGDYWQQKANFDLLFGFALGRGIEVNITQDSQIGRPYPWQPHLYGYDPSVLHGAENSIINAAIAEIMEMPDG